jgi:hypothetical protein
MEQQRKGLNKGLYFSIGILTGFLIDKQLTDVKKRLKKEKEEIQSITAPLKSISTRINNSYWLKYFF